MNPNAHVLKIVPSHTQQELNKKILYLGESPDELPACKTYKGHIAIYPALEQAVQDCFVYKSEFSISLLKSSAR